MERETVLTLNNNKKYVVANEIEIDNEIYLYLVDIENPYDIMFVTRENSKLIKVIDDNIISQILEKIQPKDIE